MNTLDEMWAALAEHKPKRRYAKAWRVMRRERTEKAAWAAYWAALTAREAQRAIDAIREVQS